MSELLKLLDSSIDDVKAGLAGKSAEDLEALRAAEADGKTRKGVLEAIAAALAALDAPHPAAVPARSTATGDQNRVDFNDPTISGQEAVERNLAESAPDAE